MRPLKDRFLEKTKKVGGCLEWTGAVNQSGYGTIWNGRADLSHRVAWGLSNGRIPDGLHVLHKCDNRKCVLDSHLFLGTNAENVLDREEKGRGKVPNTAGSKNGQAKLNEGLVKQIRSLRNRGLKQIRIAEKFGLSQQAVSYAVNGWKSVA